DLLEMPELAESSRPSHRADFFRKQCSIAPKFTKVDKFEQFSTNNWTDRSVSLRANLFPIGRSRSWIAPFCALISSADVHAAKGGCASEKPILRALHSQRSKCLRAHEQSRCRSPAPTLCRAAWSSQRAQRRSVRRVLPRLCRAPEARTPCQTVGSAESIHHRWALHPRHCAANSRRPVGPCRCRPSLRRRRHQTRAPL